MKTKEGGENRGTTKGINGEAIVTRHISLQETTGTNIGTRKGSNKRT